MEVRLLDPERLPDWVTLWNRVQPHWQTDVQAIELEDGLRPADEPLLRLVVENHGQFVAFGHLWVSDWGESIRGAAFAQIGVDPDSRRRELGTRLALQLEAFARDRGIGKLVGYATTDDFEGAEPFLQLFGFTEVEREQTSVQEPMAVDRSALPRLRRDLQAAGIEVVAFSTIDSPANRRRLHEAAIEMEDDVPSRFDWELPSFPFFEARWFGLKISLPDAIFVAREGERIVGISSLERRQDTNMDVGLTGTARTHRRRGIARVLKLMATEYAAARGVARVHTGNATVNQGMLSLNRSLGFRPGPIEVSFEKVLELR
jgi:GNAT superfamily N-acetyltransferase